MIKKILLFVFLRSAHIHISLFSPTVVQLAGYDARLPAGLRAFPETRLNHLLQGNYKENLLTCLLRKTFHNGIMTYHLCFGTLLRKYVGIRRLISLRYSVKVYKRLKLPFNMLRARLCLVISFALLSKIQNIRVLRING